MSAINVEMSSEIRTERDGMLLASDVKPWLDRLPDGAVLTQIIEDRGNQRDPWPVLVGLRATWSEVR